MSNDPYPSRLSRGALTALCAFFFGACNGLAFGAAYPERPVRIIVPFTAGSSADLSTRQFTPKLGEILRQPILIDNQAGGGGIVGTDMVAKAAPNGYTLLFATVSHAVRGSLQKVPYDTINDFSAITRLGSASMVLVVNPSVPAKSVSELVAYVKSRPGQVNFASIGNGTMGHLAGVQFNNLPGVNAVHVPYKGAAQAMADVLANSVSVWFYTYISLAPMIKAGKLKVLATTGERRTSTLPDVPTMIESGVPDFLATTWHGIYAPARTPRNIIDTLYSAFAEVIKDPAILAQMQRDGIDPAPASPEEFAAFTLTEVERYQKLIARSGAKADN